MKAKELLSSPLFFIKNLKNVLVLLLVMCANTMAFSQLYTGAATGQFSSIYFAPAAPADNVSIVADRNSFKMFLKTNTQDRVTIDGSGNVGIATTAPNAPLEIFNSTEAAMQMTSSGGYSFRMFQYSTTWNGLTHPFVLQGVGGSGTSDMAFTPVTGAPASGIVIKSAGSVGIGIIAPASKLHVADGVFQVSGSTTPANSKLGLTIGDASTYTWIQSNTAKHLCFNTATNATSNIGIGTTTPSSRLHLSDGVFQVTGPSNSPDNTKAGLTLGESSTSAWIQSNTGKPLCLNAASGTNHFVLVGMPLSNLTGQQITDIKNGNYKLAVGGKILCNEVRVKYIGNWPDHVFDKEYKLRPLKEVELFIKENNHLPDVPSEKEVAEKGIEIGEMNAILLKKMEEMTLYMLNMQKQIEELKKVNEQLLQSK